MFRILALSICIATIIASVEINPRIYGGYSATPGMFPYMASIWYMGKFQCGGSIISKKYILTAAYCFPVTLPNYYSVSVGSIYSNMSGINYLVKKIINHPKYYVEHYENESLKAIYNDISLIVVTRMIIFSETVNSRPINKWERNLVGVQAFASGWGRTEYELQSSYLIYDVYTIEDIDKCAKTFRTRFDNSQYLCTWPLNGRGIGCGDGGGPLVYNNYIIGIVSVLRKHCSYSNVNPSLYTNVAHYAKWIQEIIENN